ncbi:MAG: hypothetical protein IKS05_02025 [Oscillospiraceae bacterium]|nr:hypothetical protein [Oscillospiraceae bacterium]
MKKMICLFLALLLLCGCTPAAEPSASSTLPTSEAAAPTSGETVPATTEAALAGPEALDADSVLLYRQEDFEARQGTLLPLDELLAASAEALFPRTHSYDERFPGDHALWLRLLDYALANGFQGFSVPAGCLPELDLTQRRVLKFIYWIDGGKILSLDQDGCTTVWYACEKPDTMEKFSLGLAAAREVAAQAPRGDDWETANWLFTWLGENVSYGDRTPYYFRRGHMLYDALVEKDCLCSGYATAMCYLCNLCGVECLNIFGLARDSETAGGLGDHLWNFVRIYGRWYVCDPTMNAVSRMDRPAIGFGLSAETMYLMGGNKPTGEYTDAALVPACETNFDPVTAWNATPEGALRSFLWFAAYDALEPSFLLMQAGLMTMQTQVTPAEDGVSASLDIPYADFSVWADRFMSEEARAEFPIRFSETEAGGLFLQKSETDTRDFWRSLALHSVSDNGDGSYRADLGAASAVFTVSQSDDGLYRIETIKLTKK